MYQRKDSFGSPVAVSAVIGVLAATPSVRIRGRPGRSTATSEWMACPGSACLDSGC